MAVDAGIVLAGISVLLVLIGMMAGLVWLVVGLTVSPIRKDLDYIKGRVKSEDELKLMIKNEVHKHKTECFQYRQTETSSFRAAGISPPAAGGK